MKKLVPHDKFLELVEVIGSMTGSMLSVAKQALDELEKKIASNEESTVALTQKVDSLGDLESRIAELESYHPAVADQGPASEYTGTGWYKATDTGVVYNKDVPEGETHIFEGDPVEYISVWDKAQLPELADRAATSNITDMSYVFLNPETEESHYTGQKVIHWDVSSVTDMTELFSGATSFNQDISNWDVSNVTYMVAMFIEAQAFNQPIDKWNVANVENMNGMFVNANHFNQDLSQWCVTKIPSKPSRFDEGATSWTLPQPVWGTCPRGEIQVV